MKRGEINFDRINANDLREGIIAIIFSLAYIVSAVVFIRWFRRAYFNLHQRVSNLKYTEGWAAGAWFIPFFNWFGPYNIFKDLFTQSSNILQSKGVTMKSTLNMNVVNVYWAFWVLGSLIANVSFQLTRRGDISALSTSTALSIAANFMSLVAAFLLIQIIRSYNDVEPLLEDMRSEIDEIGAIEQN